MRTLRMLSGLAARFKGWLVKPEAPRRETDRDRRAAEALASMRDANDAMAAMATASAGAAKAVRDFGECAESLGGCYHDAVAYSLGYEASDGVIELCGETFTSLNSGKDGGAEAALRRHRQNFDPGRDIQRIIVALRPVKVIEPYRTDGTPSYGLSPGPLAGNPITAEVWGEHVASGRFEVVKRAVEMVKQDCERRGVDISKSTVTVSVKPHDGQEAFARCEPASRLQPGPDTPCPARADGGRIGVPVKISTLVHGETCGHPGCLSHVSHPCEGCGRIAGMAPPDEPTKKACGECSCPYCECDGGCDPDYATSCHRCDTWVCGYCVVEGACHNCFSKMQGGVN